MDAWRNRATAHARWERAAPAGDRAHPPRLPSPRVGAALTRVLSSSHRRLRAPQDLPVRRAELCARLRGEVSVPRTAVRASRAVSPLPRGGTRALRRPPLLSPLGGSACRRRLSPPPLPRASVDPVLTWSPPAPLAQQGVLLHLGGHPLEDRARALPQEPPHPRASPSPWLRSPP